MAKPIKKFVHREKSDMKKNYTHVIQLLENCRLFLGSVAI